MRYVCLLRGINVSGHRKLTMKELLDMCGELGFTDTASYLQSGNLILNSDLDRDAVEKRLEQAIRSCFNYPDVDVLAWTGAQLAAALGAIPPAWQGYDTGKLHFSFLKQPPKAGRAALSSYLPDEYALGQQVVYVHCPDGYGRSKLNNTFFEKLFDTRATTRNWNTTNKLLELARS